MRRPAKVPLDSLARESREPKIIAWPPRRMQERRRLSLRHEAPADRYNLCLLLLIKTCLRRLNDP